MGHKYRPNEVVHGDGTNAFELITHNQFDELIALLTGCHGDKFFTARDTQFGASLLHYAAAKGHKLCIETLLSQPGVDKNAKDKVKGASPLHWAASVNQAFAVRQMLMHEADVNARDANGQTSLSWAAGNNSVAAIHELLLWGAAPTTVDRSRKTPLHWSAYRGQVEATRRLAEAVTPNERSVVDYDGYKPGDVFDANVPEESREAIRQSILSYSSNASGGLVSVAESTADLLVQSLRSGVVDLQKSSLLANELYSLKRRLRYIVESGVLGGQTERTIGASNGMEVTLTSHLAAIEKVNNALAWFEDTQQHGECITTTTTTPRYRQYSAPTDLDEALIEEFCSIDGEEGNENTTSADTEGGGGVTITTPTTTSSAVLRFYDLDVLSEACGNFATSNIIGRGGFGAVFKGTIMGLPVAIKKFDASGLQGRKEFSREIQVLSACRNENIVPLLGACMEPLCVVYRLIPNNSLRYHLSSKARRSLMPCPVRVKIALDVAKGLQYLHSDTVKPKIIHRDIKPENVLLDESNTARLSDFGMSHVGDGGSRPQREDDFLQGDFHYMCPKFLETGRVTESNDIYAFGVVLCELLTGSPPYESCRDPPGIVEYLRRAMSSPRQLQEAVDPVAKWKKKSCTSFARIAIACVQCDPHDRPNIESIIQDIEQILDKLKRPHHEYSLTSEGSGDLDGIGCSNSENRLKFIRNSDGGSNKIDISEPRLSGTVALSHQVVSPSSSPSSSCDVAVVRKQEDFVVGDLIELDGDNSVSVSISSHEIWPLSNYGIPIENIGHSFRWGSLLASNPRLLCSCSNTTNDNHVHILDLWEMEKGRVVKFGFSTPLKSANMSPNQNEAFIAAQSTNGLLLVLSMQRQGIVAQLRSSACVGLRWWRWLDVDEICLIYEDRVALWSVMIGRDSQYQSSSEIFSFNLRETSGIGRIGGFSRSMDKLWGLVWLDDGEDTWKPRGFDLHSFTGSRMTHVFQGLAAALLHVQRSNLVVNALALMREGGQIDILDVDTSTTNATVAMQRFETNNNLGAWIPISSSSVPFHQRRGPWRIMQWPSENNNIMVVVSCGDTSLFVFDVQSGSTLLERNVSNGGSWDVEVDTVHQELVFVGPQHVCRVSLIFSGNSVRQ